MAAPDYFTWDGDPPNSILPHRPSTEDCGRDDLENDPENPPDPEIHPTAEGHNQVVQQVVGMSKSVTAAKIEVRFTAGAPAIYRITGPRTGLVVGNLEIFDDGPGVTRIKDTLSIFPARAMAPGGLTIIDDTAAPAGVQWGQVVEVAPNEIRVRTFVGVTPTDLNFRIDWD